MMKISGIRRQANINDDILVEQVDNFIAKNFAQIVDENSEFTHLPLIKVLIKPLNEEDQFINLIYKSFAGSLNFEN